MERSPAPNGEKLSAVRALESRFVASRLPEDSVYARILHRMGVLQHLAGNPGAAIEYTRRAIRINTSGRPGTSLKAAVISFNNLGSFYLDQGYYTAAAEAFDHCIALGRTFSDSLSQVKMSSARQKKGFIYHQLGDDQKDVTETTLGLRTALRYRNNTVIVDLYNERAQAYASLQQGAAALEDLDQALAHIGLDDPNAYADNCKWRGYVLDLNGDAEQAKVYYINAIRARKQVPGSLNLANDYLDAGNVLMRERAAPATTRTYYREALLLARAQGDRVIAGKALNNLALLHARASDYRRALLFYQQCLSEVLTGYVVNTPLQEPSLQQGKGASKVLLYQVLGNRTECLLRLYKQTGDSAYLKACMRSALLTDSVITAMRQEQTEELSKLHWLKDARDFFAVALEACYLASDPVLVFYFMEKSRSVLLNDKLNELGANTLLPPDKAARERMLQLQKLTEEQRLWKLAPSDALYREQESRYLLAKEKVESFIRTLQQEYPVYYQYKYADRMPSLPELQARLKGEGQTFVHYFVSDTSVYVLCTTPTSTQLVRKEVRITGLLNEFLDVCSDKQTLNRNYARFAQLSNRLYSLLFAPLAIPTKRIIVCNDNFLLPFEALSPDSSRKSFLVDRFIFSYAYSARSLMKKTTAPPASGDCLLVAPGTYAPYLQLSNLDESTRFLQASEDPYSDNRLLAGQQANRKTFLEEFPRYRIVNIYSHATADRTGAEPYLYLCDSIVRLSQLEMISRPATQLVVLSACETGAGTRAEGEGIYSLARGFAAAGIPAIASTLWKADARATSEITSLFHQNLGRGLRKDEALQRAKLTFMQQHGRGQMLPYYWANIILAGDTTPIETIAPHRSPWALSALMAPLVLGLLAGMVMCRKKKGITA